MEAMFRLGSLLVLPVILAGCQDDVANRTPSVVPTLDLVQSQVLTEDLRIDGIEEDLVPITDLAVSTDGTIAVVQSQDHKVRFFTSDGEPFIDFGRRGQGPGEFTAASRVGWLSDTLWVHDLDQRRFTLISPEYEFVRTVASSDQPSPKAREALGLPGFARLVPRHLLSGNVVLAGVLNPSNETDQIWARMTMAGDLDRVVLRYDAGPEDIRYAAGNMTASAGMPYPNRPLVAVAPDGTNAIVVKAHIDDDMVGTFEVLTMSTFGDTVRHRQYQFEPLEISRATADSIIDARADDLEERYPPLARRYRREAVVPPIYPPIRGAMIGIDGTVWIRLRTGDRIDPYLILDVKGDPIARVALPPATFFAVVSRNTVWAVERDDVGIQSVVRYRMTGR